MNALGSSTDRCNNTSETAIGETVANVDNGNVTSTSDISTGPMLTQEKNSPSSRTIVTIDASSSDPAPLEKEPSSYSTIRIDDHVWSSRLQDVGCSLESLPKRSYRQNKVPPYGPNSTYYYDLSSIAIDYIKNIAQAKKNGYGWKRLPKNITDVKLKLIGLLLELRTETEDGTYVLDQTNFLKKIETLWGIENTSLVTEDNDKIRLIGILFLDTNSDKLYRLAQGVHSKNDLDDPSMNIKGVFQLLALDFNNNDIHISLPDEAEDMEEDINLNPNDPMRIRIQRDCK